MPLKQELIDDIELRLYQGKPSDDIELEKSQISYWLDLYRDVILTNSLNEKIKNKEEIEPFYIKSSSCLKAVKEYSQCEVDCTKNRYSIDVPNDILPLTNDRGIIRIVNHKGISLNETTQNRIEVLLNLPFGKINKSSQAYYREGNKIFIHEISDLSSSMYSYTIFYVPMSNGFSTGLLSSYPLEDSLIPILLDTVENVAFREMNKGTADLDNDGKDPYHK